MNHQILISKFFQLKIVQFFETKMIVKLFEKYSEIF